MTAQADDRSQDADCAHLGESHNPTGTLAPVTALDQSDQWACSGNCGGFDRTRTNAMITATGDASDPALASNVKSAQYQLQSDLISHQRYPVVQVGFVYQF